MSAHRVFWLLALVSLLGAGCAGASCPEGGAAGLCEARPPSDELVGPLWLLEHLDDAGLQIIDVRTLGEFEAARIPGALYLDDAALRATVMGIAGQVAPPAEVEAAFAAAGIRDDARLIIYSGTLDTSAARVWWTLLLHGHRDAQVLDWGFAGWSDAGHPTDSGASASSPSSYQAGAVDEALRVDADFVEAQLASPDVVLVDARSAAEYAAGHIPGALSVDWNENLEEGSLRARAELESLYASIDASATVITYCQTGSRASVAFLVLRHLGFADVRLYDGSWAEWGSDMSRPVE